LKVANAMLDQGLVEVPELLWMLMTPPFTDRAAVEFSV